MWFRLFIRWDLSSSRIDAAILDFVSPVSSDVVMTAHLESCPQKQRGIHFGISFPCGLQADIVLHRVEAFTYSYEACTWYINIANTSVAWRIKRANNYTKHGPHLMAGNKSIWMKLVIAERAVVRTATVWGTDSSGLSWLETKRQNTISYWQFSVIVFSFLWCWWWWWWWWWCVWWGWRWPL